jgi:hypothetical protein
MMTSTDTRLWALDAHDTATQIRLGRMQSIRRSMPSHWHWTTKHCVRHRPAMQRGRAAKP